MRITSRGGSAVKGGVGRAADPLSLTTVPYQLSAIHTDTPNEMSPAHQSPADWPQIETYFRLRVSDRDNTISIS